jgi:maleylacetate reductase
MWTGTIALPAIERIIAGLPAAEALRGEVERLDARRVFLLVSRSMNRGTQEVAKLRDALGPRCAGLHEGIPPHTPIDAVIEAAAAARAAEADLIVTFGGGSVTDAGKVLQLCLRHDITEMDALEPFRMVTEPDGTRRIPDYAGPVVRQVAIPTTLSGGEYNSQAGSTHPVKRVKQSFRHPLHVPRATILDPRPTLGTPLWVWLSTGIRAVDHATEGLCSPLANPVSDASALQALRLLSRALPRVKADPADLEARQDCQLAVWLSVAGRWGGVQMGASHAIGHVLGGTCGVPHGYTSCVMLPHVLRYNQGVNAHRQALVAEALGRPGEAAADAVAALVAALGLPGRLSEVGVGREHFALVAANTMRDPWLHTNPRRITTPEQVVEILEAAA